VSRQERLATVDCIHEVNPSLLDREQSPVPLGSHLAVVRSAGPEDAEEHSPEQQLRPDTIPDKESTPLPSAAGEGGALRLHRQSDRSLCEPASRRPPVEPPRPDRGRWPDGPARPGSGRRPVEFKRTATGGRPAVSNTSARERAIPAAPPCQQLAPAWSSAPAAGSRPAQAPPAVPAALAPRRCVLLARRGQHRARKRKQQVLPASSRSRHGWTRLGGHRSRYRGGSAGQRHSPPCEGLPSTLRRRWRPPCGRWADAHGCGDQCGTGGAAGAG
jgi:hypothetical protein